jgi:hypothetical protein
MKGGHQGRSWERTRHITGESRGGLKGGAKECKGLGDCTADTGAEKHWDGARLAGARPSERMLYIRKMSHHMMVT